jgi:aspartate aminotransferase
MSDLIAARVDATVPPAVSRILQAARRLEAEGLTLTYLMRGEPDFATPEHIRRAASRALDGGETHYGPTQGIPELRRAIARRMQRDHRLEFDPEREVLVTTGATMGIYVALMAVVNPGDEVLLFDPVYDPYPTIVQLAGGTPVRLPAHSNGDGHFSVAPADLERAVSKQTKAILINNPWNPTGTVMGHAELRTLVELAEAHDLVLIADEIYEKLTFDGRTHFPLAAISPAARARTITINSFSKTYAMTGWRMGYNLAPPAFAGAMLRIAEQFSRSAATFVQRAGVEALDGPQEEVERMVDQYAERRALLTDTFHRAGHLAFTPPEGTFFALLDVRRFERDAESMADYLLRRAHVVTIPASVYGAAGEGFLRLSFAYNRANLERGLAAVLQGLAQLE